MSGHRKLLVFRSTHDARSYEQQMAELQAHAQDRKERDLLIVEGDEKLRGSFHVPADEFAIVLIGKDGGEKLRRHTPLTVRELNAVIDAMPMRQQEMRKH